MTAAAALKHRARMAGECAQCREESFRWDADEGAVACQNKYCGAFAPVGDYTFEIRPVACPFLPELTIENKDGHRNCYAEPAPRNGKGRGLVYQIWPRGNYGFGIHSMPWHTLLVCRPTWEDAEKYARAEWREWLESQGWGRPNEPAHATARRRLLCLRPRRARRHRLSAAAFGFSRR